MIKKAATVVPTHFPAVSELPVGFELSNYTAMTKADSTRSPLRSLQNSRMKLFLVVS